VSLCHLTPDRLLARLSRDFVSRGTIDHGDWVIGGCLNFPLPPTPLSNVLTNGVWVLMLRTNLLAPVIYVDTFSSSLLKTKVKIRVIYSQWRSETSWPVCIVWSVAVLYYFPNSAALLPGLCRHHTCLAVAVTRQRHPPPVLASFPSCYTNIRAPAEC
jgi:hypothetical protein